ncbi:hypothetical protein KJ359_005463 [Pestalotiopsis sp. 9143b]|nr:hypothetical protein KJ359_005463 [Pestalotiopsis sp. 9143b]
MEQNSLGSMLQAMDAVLTQRFEGIKARSHRGPELYEIRPAFRVCGQQVMTLLESNCGDNYKVSLRWIVSEILGNLKLRLFKDADPGPYAFDNPAARNEQDVADLSHLIDVIKMRDLSLEEYFEAIMTNGQQYPKTQKAPTLGFRPMSNMPLPGNREKYFVCPLGGHTWAQALQVKRTIQTLMHVSVQLIPYPLSARLSPFIASDLDCDLLATKAVSPAEMRFQMAQEWILSWLTRIRTTGEEEHLQIFILRKLEQQMKRKRSSSQ